MYTSYEDMAIFWLGYFEGRNKTHLIYPIENLDANLELINMHQIGPNFFAYWLPEGLETFGIWTRFASYLSDDGYITGYHSIDPTSANSYEISDLNPIVPLHDRNNHSECNQFYFKDADFKSFDYAIVITSVVCIISGLVYGLIAILEGFEIINEIVLLRIYNPNLQGYVRGFLKFGGIDACNCGTKNLDEHSSDCPTYEEVCGERSIRKIIKHFSYHPNMNK